MPSRCLQSSGDNVSNIIQVSITRKGILHCISLWSGSRCALKSRAYHVAVQLSPAALLSDGMLQLLHLVSLPFKHMTSKVAVEEEEGLMNRAGNDMHTSLPPTLRTWWGDFSLALRKPMQCFSECLREKMKSELVNT